MSGIIWAFEPTDNCKTSPKEWAGSVETKRIFSVGNCLAKARAKPQERVVLPTPPLPVKKIKLRELKFCDNCEKSIVGIGD